ncbi:MAG TPA: SGNH/GDSL hydrolase family protein [Kribbella sp.]
MQASTIWLQSFIAAIMAIGATISPGTSVVTADPQNLVGPSLGWVGSWAASVTPPGPRTVSATGVSNITLRQVAHLSIGGSGVRLRLSNRYGTKPVVVGSTTVASRRDNAAGTPKVERAKLVPVRFGGDLSITIPVGVEVVSDPIGITVADDSDLVISTYFPNPTGPLTQHPAGYATAFAAKGDRTRDLGPSYRKMGGTARYLIDGVDVKSSARGSVVLFGDSITDGASTAVDRNRRYPDQLADMLLTQPADRVLGVLNAGISGNRLLSNSGTAGDAGLARFERDVIRRPGVRTVVVLEGINDLRGSRGAITLQQLIAAHRKLIRQAKAAGLTVIGATLTPFWGADYYTVAGEVTRQALNQWIRTSHEYDGVVDFDKAVRDPRAPLQFRASYDAGDHLHPNANGTKAMARTFNLAALIQ